MAKQLNLMGGGQVISTALHAEMEQSYLEYAMSVIVGRALPDVRDGLKPVHRRILYAMHELGLTPDRPFRKCARVVGDVLGKYHPHGDQAVYDALVRMVQGFSCRYPLLAGHGNFGSVDNDPPAAMRYTETRLAAISQEALLENIGEATVDFVANFDNSQQEPVVLPAQLPILLLNGCAGIAVGMATNVPPHNLGELVDGLIALIDKPDLPDEQLWQLIPGPDFPTGGEIVDPSGIRDAYRSGRGTIRLRGKVHIEHLHFQGRRRDRTALVITELPYQVNKAGWIEKVAELVNNGRLEGIADLRDESDRSGMRVVVELKRDTDPQTLTQALYHQTALQTNFGAILLALVDNKPSQLSLRQLLEEFLQFRERTLTRQCRHDLEQTSARLHLSEGSIVALEQIDLVIEILRSAPDGSSAKAELREVLDISDPQADSILAMPLRRLTGLERQKLETEVEQLREQIGELERLLGDRRELLKALKKELRTLKRRYGDERRTSIVAAEQVSASGSNERKTSTPEPSATARGTLELSARGNLRFSTSDRSKDNEADPRVSQFPSDRPLVVFTSAGKARPVEVERIPTQSKRQLPLSQFVRGMGADEAIVTSTSLPEDLQERDSILVSATGRIKRLPLEELDSLTARGASLVKLKDDDTLAHVVLTGVSSEELAIATNGGRLLRLAIDDSELPIMGRTARGNLVTRLRQNERIVGCCAVSSKTDLVLVTAMGYAKRLNVKAVPRKVRGDIGVQALQFVKPKDRLVGMVVAGEVAVESDRRWFTFDGRRLTQGKKEGTGDRLSQLQSGETILSLLPCQRGDKLQ